MNSSKKILSALLFLCVSSFSLIQSVEPVLNSYVTEIQDGQLDAFLQRANKPVIIDFWAKWCSPCMQMKPTFEQLASELNGKYHFVSVNADQGKQIIKKYGIQSIPTFIVINNNTVITQFAGLMTKEGLKSGIENALNPSGYYTP